MIIYIYREIIFYSQGVVTPMCISLDLRRIWPDEVYVDGVYYHTRPSRVLCMTSMYVYLEYMVILILYATEEPSGASFVLIFWSAFEAKSSIILSYCCLDSWMELWPSIIVLATVSSRGLLDNSWYGLPRPND